MRSLILAVFLGGILAGSLPAQAPNTGMIAGTITDPAGRPAVGIAVLLTDHASKAVQRAITSNKGEYSLTLAAGTYDLLAQGRAIHFRPFTKDGVQVTAGETRKIDIRLEEGRALNTLGDGLDFDTARAARPRAPVPAGPTPRMADGKPDLSGYWSVGGGANDVGIAEFQDPAVALAAKRYADEMRESPLARCQPTGIVWNAQNGAAQRFVQSPGLLVMFSEGQPLRQIFLDGRNHPPDPNPTWLGHSVGRWEGETLVVDTIGFNDRAWLDAEGHPQTEHLHLVERYRRPDLGHLEQELRIEDPTALKKPWIIKRTYVLDPTDDVMESICTENEKDLPHMYGGK